MNLLLGSGHLCIEWRRKKKPVLSWRTVYHSPNPSWSRIEIRIKSSRPPDSSPRRPWGLKDRQMFFLHLPLSLWSLRAYWKHTSMSCFKSALQNINACRTLEGRGCIKQVLWKHSSLVIINLNQMKNTHSDSNIYYIKCIFTTIHVNNNTAETLFLISNLRKDRISRHVLRFFVLNILTEMFFKHKPHKILLDLYL